MTKITPLVNGNVHLPDYCLIDGKGKIDGEQFDISSIFFGNSFAQLTKISKKILPLTTQIHTGSLMLDYSNPVFAGNFVLVSGKPKHGKTAMLHKTAENFLRQSDKNKLFYLSFDRRKGYSLDNTLRKTKLNRSACLIVPSESASSVESYRLPFLMLALIKEELQKGTENILVLVDDLNSHFVAELQVYDLADQAKVAY